MVHPFVWLSSGLPLSLPSVPKSERTTVHKNLILALAAGEALLMFSELAKSNQVSSPRVAHSAHVARLQHHCHSNGTEVFINSLKLIKG